MYSNTVPNKTRKKMLREKFYDVLAGILVLAVAGAYSLIISAHQKGYQVDENTKEITNLKQEFKEEKDQRRKEFRELIDLLHRMEIKIEQKQNRK